MTYRKLLEQLNRMTDAELDQSATVHLLQSDEFLPVAGIWTVEETDVLDKGHVVIDIEF